MSADVLQKAFASTAAVLANVKAGQLLENARGFIPDAMRGADGQAPFGPRIDVPESAPAADQLAGFLGRQV